MRSHQFRTPLAGVLLTLVVIGGLVGAPASGLGLTSRTLTGFAESASAPAPIVITCDDFARSASTGNALNNRPVQSPANCGSSRWAVHSGNWQRNGSEVRTNGAHSTATLPAGGMSRMIEATISNAGGGSDVTGVSLAHNGSSLVPTYLAAALVGSGTVQLRIVVGPLVTTVTSASASITSTTRLRLSLSGGTARVWVNGSQRITHNLSALQLTTIASGTRAGLYDHNNSGRYGQVLVMQVWP